MSFSLSNIGRQKTIAGLAKAVFDVKGDPELQKVGEEALLNANPGLAEEGGMKPGTPIIVPQLRDPLAPGPDRAPVLPPAAVSAVRAAAAADLAGAPLDAALKEAVDGAKMLKTKAVADAIAAARPDLKDQLPAIAAEAEQEAKRAAEAVAELRAALAQLKGAVPDLPAD
ncbi:MAG: hypothetical protein QOG13_322 [Sphingomonadales bacterium]|jgi:hypothetical protein|nr:hypothetical protein [Sphingomonadales bacterium]MEA3043912.1 hypothetical protein [Sphingomonadales bacterium]